MGDEAEYIEGAVKIDTVLMVTGTYAHPVVQNITSETLS